MKENISDFDQILIKLRDNDSSLTSLALIGTKLTSENIKNLAEALHENTHLKKIDLSNSGIDAQGAEFIAEALKINKTLESLDLSNNNIGDDGVKHILEALNENKTLIELGIHKNGIGDDGVIAIVEKLKSISLKTIDIGLNRKITKDGLDKLMEVENGIVIATYHSKPTGFIDNCEYKETDDIVHTILNPRETTPNKIIFLSGVAYIAKLIRENQIQNLDLSKNNIGVEGARAIAEAIKQNTSLRTLDLSQNNIGDEGAGELNNANFRNYSVVSINLSGNKIMPAGFPHAGMQFGGWIGGGFANPPSYNFTPPNPQKKPRGTKNAGNLDKIGETTLSQPHLLNLLNHAIYEGRNELMNEVDLAVIPTNPQDQSLDHSLVDAIKKFINADGQDKISIALCQGDLQMRGGIEQIIGDSHWTGLHLRKIKHENNKISIKAYYMDSMWDGNDRNFDSLYKIPESVTRVLNNSKELGVIDIDHEAVKVKCNIQKDNYSCGYHTVHNLQTIHKLAITGNEAIDLTKLTNVDEFIPKAKECLKDMHDNSREGRRKYPKKPRKVNSEELGLSNEDFEASKILMSLSGQDSTKGPKRKAPTKSEEPSENLSINNQIARLLCAVSKKIKDGKGTPTLEPSTSPKNPKKIGKSAFKNI